MFCAQQVFRCFKWLERLGDRFTGAAGPVFVALAVILLAIGLVCFCELSTFELRLFMADDSSLVDVIQPSLPAPWITTPVCVLIACNLFTHYYFVCTVPPGFVDDSPRVSQSGFMWARKRKSARSRALTGVRWTDDASITKAAVSKCRRCGVLRPEVSVYRCGVFVCLTCALFREHIIAGYAINVS